jgi:hypothetical protein
MEPGQFLGYNFGAGTGASEHVGRTRSWQLESPEVFSLSITAFRALALGRRNELAGRSLALPPRSRCDGDHHQEIVIWNFVAGIARLAEMIFLKLDFEPPQPW